MSTNRNEEPHMSLHEVTEKLTQSWEAKNAIEDLRIYITDRFDKMDERLDKLEGDTQPIIQARKERETAFKYGKKVGTNVWNFGKWISGISVLIAATYAAFKAGFVEAVQEAMKHADKIPPNPPPGIGH